MKFLGNILWLLLGGLVTAIMYWLAGLLTCCTIIGIPFGVQLFKIGLFAFWPFGHQLENNAESGGCLQNVFNVLWVLCGWWEIALVHFFFGIIFCITLVGIPLGKQHFKIAIGSFFPFGKKIIQSA